jgi:hypothetical protein
MMDGFNVAAGVKKKIFTPARMPWVKISLTIYIVSSPGFHRIDGSGAGLVGGR